MRNIIKWLKNIFYKIIYFHCPDCKGIMKFEKYDYSGSKFVYKCTKCGKEWI